MNDQGAGGEREKTPCDPTGFSAPIDLKEAKLSPREALLEICDEAEVWRSTEGVAIATIRVEDHLEHWPVHSRSFRGWMLQRLARGYSSGGRPASANEKAMCEVLSAMEARALVGGQTRSAALRVAETDGEIVIDLGTSDWSAVVVTPQSWSIVQEPPLPILRSKRTAPFPSPAATGDFKPLRNLLSHLDEDTFVLFVSWCVGALLPSGPFPILVLGGEQGSGKSTLARLAQRLTDPVTGDLLQPPGNDRDLIAAAKHSRVMCFDNLSQLKPDLADSLCRIATGSEIGGRALHTDHDLATFSACRPQIINGIPDLAVRSDLADRSIVLRLPRLPERITEKDWQGRLQRALPPTFAGLLDALSLGLRSLDDTRTPDLRMADFGRFVLAAEPALPWEPGRFIQAYQRSRLEVDTVLVESDSVASAIRRFMQNRSNWTGMMSQLYEELSHFADRGGVQPSDWPRGPRGLSGPLQRASPPLLALGIDVNVRRCSEGSKVTLRLVEQSLEAPTFATSRAPNAGAASVPLNGANVANVANYRRP